LAFTNPSVADFKAYFVRDFAYGATSDVVMDADITRAIYDSSININTALFPDQANYTNAFLQLTAHNLVLNIRASSQGLSGVFNFPTVSRGVGQVSEGFQIPQRISDDPVLSMLTKTTYGAKYLSIVLPFAVGNMFSSTGMTQA
jgi:hypothetical protein